MNQLELIFEDNSKPISLAQALSKNKDILIIISVIKNGVRIEVIRQKHDPIHIKNWFFFAASDKGIPQLPPWLNNEQDNLLKRIDLFYARASDDELDKYSSGLFEFRMAHDLRFAFRGTDIPSTIIYRRNENLYIAYRQGEYFHEDLVSFHLLTRQSNQGFCTRTS